MKAEAHQGKNKQNTKDKILRKIHPCQEKNWLGSQDKILTVFFLTLFFFLVFLYHPWPTNLANFSWLFLAVFFFRAKNGKTLLTAIYIVSGQENKVSFSRAGGYLWSLWAAVGSAKKLLQINWKSGSG